MNSLSIPSSWADPTRKDYPYLTKLKWNTSDRFKIEATMIRNGGRFGGHGEGIDFHYKAAIAALWPDFEWHRWSHLLTWGFAGHDEVAVLGPASSGKTFDAAAYALTTFFVWPTGTSIIMSSTTKEGLELRVWGAVKKLYNSAKRRRNFLPGHMIQSRTMLSGAPEEDEAKDFRDGIIGVACKVGGTFVGISNYVGVKNDRLVLIADEASLMGRGFLDSLSNLRKGAKKRFQFICMGNPKDRTDALGVAAEPAMDVGGWEGYDGAARTQVWPTRAKNGLAIQICGYDSPNYDFPRGKNPWSGIITPEQIEADLAYYGENTLQFSMMNLGIMPKDASTRRVVTMQIAEQRNCFDRVVWGSGTQLRGAGLDPAYRGTGGDRCALTPFLMGPDRDGIVRIECQPQIVVPVNPSSRDTPEDQIALFCRDHCAKEGILPSNFGFDSTGRGSLAIAFAQLWSPEVIPVEFGGPPPDRPARDGDPRKESELYAKMVSALWFASYNAMETSQLRGLSREAVEEGCLREWGMVKNSGGRRAPLMDVEPKEKTKARMGRSPDLWDSICVAIEVARRRGFVIQSGPAGISVQTRKPAEWLVRLGQKHRQLAQKQNLTPV